MGGAKWYKCLAWPGLPGDAGRAVERASCLTACLMRGHWLGSCKGVVMHACVLLTRDCASLSRKCLSAAQVALPAVAGVERAAHRSRTSPAPRRGCA